MTSHGFETIPGLPQLFILRQDSQQGKVSFIAAKVVDDILLAGTSKELRRLFASISNRFKVGRYISGRPFVFNRVLISPTNDHSASMSEFMETIVFLLRTRKRRNQHEEKCPQEELTALQSLAGKLNFLGHGALPQACLVAREMQQNVRILRVKHIQQANAVLHLLKRLPCALQYRSSPSLFDCSDMGDLSLLSFAEASTGHSSYGQTGFVTGLIMRRTDLWIYQVLDWYSLKQSRVSFSSVGAEILTTAEAADRPLLLTQYLSSIVGKHNLFPLVLTVESCGLYATITTLHEGKDYRLRPTVSGLRDSFKQRIYQFSGGFQVHKTSLTH